MKYIQLNLPLKWPPLTQKEKDDIPNIQWLQPEHFIVVDITRGKPTRKEVIMVGNLINCLKYMKEAREIYSKYPYYMTLDWYSYDNMELVFDPR